MTTATHAARRLVTDVAVLPEQVWARSAYALATWAHKLWLAVICDAVGSLRRAPLDGEEYRDALDWLVADDQWVTGARWAAETCGIDADALAALARATDALRRTGGRLRRMRVVRQSAAAMLRR